MNASSGFVLCIIACRSLYAGVGGAHNPRHELCDFLALKAEDLKGLLSVSNLAHASSGVGDTAVIFFGSLPFPLIVVAVACKVVSFCHVTAAHVPAHVLFTLRKTSLRVSVSLQHGWQTSLYCFHALISPGWSAFACVDVGSGLCSCMLSRRSSMKGSCVTPHGPGSSGNS